MWVAFAVQKLLTFFQQKISEYCIVSAKTVNEMTLNKFEQLGPGCKMDIIKYWEKYGKELRCLNTCCQSFIQKLLNTHKPVFLTTQIRLYIKWVFTGHLLVSESSKVSLDRLPTLDQTVWMHRWICIYAFLQSLMCLLNGKQRKLWSWFTLTLIWVYIVC